MLLVSFLNHAILYYNYDIKEYIRARMRNIDQNLHVRFTSSMFVTEIKSNTEKKNSKKKMTKKTEKIIGKMSVYL